MTLLKNALGLSHEYIKSAVQSGDTVVDATCGNGHDTLFLSNLVGAKGKVYGFDIQAEAIRNTRALFMRSASFQNTALISCGHEMMEQYVPAGIAAAMFNFGYLPGGDHQKATKKETSVRGVGAAAKLLRPGGLITLCIYSGGDTGFEEKEALLAFCKTLDPKQFGVLAHEFINQKNHPPMLICIEKK